MTRILLTVALLSPALAVGCAIRSVTEVQGRYLLHKPEADVELDLKKDMTYEETTRFHSGEQLAISGQWRFDPKVSGSWQFDTDDQFVVLDGAANVSERLAPDHVHRIETGMSAGKLLDGTIQLDANVVLHLYFDKVQ
jgi:hypothetical protein